MTARPADSPAPTLGELIHQQAGRLTPAERKVARKLFTTNLMAGFDTVAGLSAECGVSGPTVVRFANKLGFNGYADFQRALRRDLSARIDSPLRLYGRAGRDGNGDPLLEVARTTFRESIDATFSGISAQAFDEVTALLADPRRGLWMSGGRFSQSCAVLLQAHLYQLRPRTQLVSYAPAGRPDALLDLGRRDVMVLFDLRRYQKDTIALADAANARGAVIVLITDPWLSPIADNAHHILTVDVEAPSPYDSLVACTALVETLVAGVIRRSGSSSRKRIAALESLREGFTWDDETLNHHQAQKQS